MIPKVIHYCWFGGSPLPKSAVKCIDSWKKYCPDYEIKRWNESNFNINICQYTREAVQLKKWAFVSDYARFWIIYNYGGIYLDTDVELLRALESVREKGPFMGIEAGNNKIAPGLGIGAEAGNPIYKEILDGYAGLHLVNADGVMVNATVVDYTSAVFARHGWQEKDELQKVSGITLYPSEVLCPYNYFTGKKKITKNTLSIHHYSATWHTPLENIISFIERSSTGKTTVEYKVRRVFSAPFRVINKVQTIGFQGTLDFINKKRCSK